METKFCRICGTEKPISDFPKNNQYKDGYDTRCKSCFNEYQYSIKRKNKGGGNPDLASFTPRELIDELLTSTSYYGSW